MVKRQSDAEQVIIVPSHIVYIAVVRQWHCSCAKGMRDSGRAFMLIQKKNIRAFVTSWTFEVNKELLFLPSCSIFVCQQATSSVFKLF